MVKKVALVACLLALTCINPGEELCGNGILDLGESCDATQFGPVRCENVPAVGENPGGVVACNQNCTLNIEQCEPCWTYPCTPEGGFVADVIQGEVVENHGFTPANQFAKDLAGEDDILDFSDFYMMSDAHDRGLKGIMIFSTTGWCPYCSLEAALLSQVYDEYRSRGIILMGLVVQDEFGQDATAEYANLYSERYAWNIPAVAGALPIEYWPSRDVAVYFPLNTFIDLTTMRVIIVAEGYLDARSMKGLLNDLLGYIE